MVTCKIEYTTKSTNNCIGSRENQLFQKLNGIGNNEEILFFQAVDEMMGHQYAIYNKEYKQQE